MSDFPSPSRSRTTSKDYEPYTVLDAADNEAVGGPVSRSSVEISVIGVRVRSEGKTGLAALRAMRREHPVVVLPPRDRDTIAQAITSRITFPLILKPLSEGGSIGMTVCHDTAERTAALSGVKATDGWFAEPFTTGTPVTCGILEVDGSAVALPPLETLPTDAEFYDYATKRDKDRYRYRCPAELPSVTLDAITAAASDQAPPHPMTALELLTQDTSAWRCRGPS